MGHKNTHAAQDLDVNQSLHCSTCRSDLLLTFPTSASSSIGFHTLVAVLITWRGTCTASLSPSCKAFSRLEERFNHFKRKFERKLCVNYFFIEGTALTLTFTRVQHFYQKPREHFLESMQMKANKFEFAFYRSLFPLTNSLLRYRQEAILFLSSFTSRAARPLLGFFVLALYAPLKLSRKFWIQMRFFLQPLIMQTLHFFLLGRGFWEFLCFL